MAKKLITSLPLMQDATFILIDEDVEEPCADNLIDGWMQMWSTANLSQQIHLLLFFNTKSHYNYLTTLFKENKLHIHDYCLEDLDKIYEKQDFNEICERIMKSSIVDEKSIVVLNCLSSLIVNIGLARALRFVDKLSQRVSQLICVYRRDFGTQKIPKIETLGTTYVRLGKSSETAMNNEISYEVAMVHCKRGGGILKKHVVITQDPVSCEIKSENPVEFKAPVLVSQVVETSVKPQASFRIDMNARELEQRNQTPLPYMQVIKDATSESQIHYIPDKNDDFDEEDPDDDLPF
ncbi:uncharacterized protein LOC123275397 [Cotesia glomerata]|uniref:Elongator complex protein 5 n=1 Tax=Cotesia glomerata TaxID=32391 RepID=A0AAV7J5H7_COTGL|nr:uncharacterized protein LOC123275397 [Cotesia glomerata]KAH0566963.1 hypothetical protein KQX54_005753 [Cotesia glomerata]